MAKVDWKTGTPKKDGVYLTTYGIKDEQYWVVLTRFENGKWQTSGDVIAWDYRPEPYEPNTATINIGYELSDSECVTSTVNSAASYTDEYVEELEWKVKDLEASWSEIHGEMKYYEGASEALNNVIKLLLRLEG